MEELAVDVVERPVLGRDLEPPRQVGRLAEQLLVPPVPEAADALRDEQAGRDAVQEARDVGPGTLRDDRAHEDPEPDAAPHPETAPPDGERPPPLVRELVPARDHVVQARPDDAGRDAPDRQPEDEVPVPAAPRPADPGDENRGADRDEQRQAVEVDRERPELDGARLGRGDGGKVVQSHSRDILPTVTSSYRKK